MLFSQSVQLFLMGEEKYLLLVFKKKIINRMKSLPLGELNIPEYLPSRVIFLGENITYYSLSWPRRGTIWNSLKGLFLFFQEHEK